MNAATATTSWPSARGATPWSRPCSRPTSPNASGARRSAHVLRPATPLALTSKASINRSGGNRALSTKASQHSRQTSKPKTGRRKSHFTKSNPEPNGTSFAYELDGASTWTAIAGQHAFSIRADEWRSHDKYPGDRWLRKHFRIAASYGWTINSTASQIETQFSGISVTTTYPPNNALAAGPDNAVMVEGSRIEWTNLTGGSPVLQSVYDFFSPLGAAAVNSLSHPYAMYDSINQRFIVIMDNSGSGHTISNVDVAVSKDSNPNDGWNFASLNTSLTINGQLTSADRPMASIDGTNIYIAEPQYNVNVSGSPGTELWVISDTAGAGGGLYNGGAPTVSASQLAPSSQGIFSVAAGNNGKAYYASDYSTGSQIDRAGNLRSSHEDIRRNEHYLSRQYRSGWKLHGPAARDGPAPRCRQQPAGQSRLFQWLSLWRF